MNTRIKTIISSFLLVLGGTYVVFLGVQEYLGPGSSIGYFAEIVLAGHLLLGGVTIWVAGYTAVHDQPRVSLTTLAGLVTLFLTFALGVYEISRNTQLDLWLGLAMIVAVSSATWLLSGWVFEAETDENAA